MSMPDIHLLTQKGSCTPSFFLCYLLLVSLSVAKLLVHAY